MKKWRYLSENLSGNLHAAAAWITEHHPEWDVVTMDSSGHYIVVVRREEYGLRIEQHKESSLHYHNERRAEHRVQCDVCGKQLED